jgi:ribonuclease HI
VLSTDAHKKEISGYKEHTTNNEMELVAVLEALKTLKRTGLSVAIYTDSQLVVGWLSGTYRVKEAHIAMLVRQINIMVQDKGLSLELFHVKAHSGNAGNERANLLAQLETAKAKAKKG